MKKMVWSVMCLVAMLVPATTFAQAGIAGAVKDTSGGVLPGVTVEAASPVLIEKVRTVVTDDRGQYKIVDLRPGDYVVTFTLVGFSTVKRDGITLAGSFTATVNADLQVGTLEETITVSGQSPVVDVQNVRQNRVVTTEAIETLPTARTYASISQVIPGVSAIASVGPTAQDVGGSATDKTQLLMIHGSHSIDQQMFIDGLPNNSANGVNSSGMFIDMGSIEEVDYQLGALPAATPYGGVQIQFIPKDGGNQFRGTLFGAYSDKRFASSNISDELRQRGLPTVNQLDKVWDGNLGIGGPIKRDKIWFYFSGRYWGVNDRVAGAWYDQDPTDLVYTPDFDRPAIDDSWQLSISVRPTWQISTKNKLTAYLLTEGRCVCHSGTNALTPPEVSVQAQSPEAFKNIVRWTSTISNRLLLEVGWAHHYYVQEHRLQPEISPDFQRVTELSTGMALRAPSRVARTEQGPIYDSLAALSYITGSHALKVGYTLQTGQRRTFDKTGDMFLHLLNGVPRQVTVQTTPNVRIERLNANFGFYAQDQWTVDRMTLNMGLRFDYHNASVPEQHMPAVRFVGARDFAEVKNVPNWMDLSPRMGAAFDLFGNGRTAVKVSLSRYIGGEMLQFPQANNPINTSVNTASRTWTDSNGDFLAQESELGPLSNSAFGTVVIRTRYDDAVREGFSVRDYNWEGSAGVQHELLTGVSVNLSYHRRWFGNFLATDNLATTPENFDPFCITGPSDPRLPGGGGQQICGLYDINPSKRGQVNNFVTQSSNFGKQQEVYDGFDFTTNARLGNGLQLAGGMNMGRTKTDTCFVIDDPTALRFCEVSPPMLINAKFMATVRLPWDMNASAVFQSVPGPMITANYTATSEQIRGSLGRDLAAGANGTYTVPLVEPGTVYGDRLNQVDLRLSKTVRLGGARLQGNLDFYNIGNANPVLVENRVYGSRWRQPTFVLPGRLIKFGAQLSF